LDLVEIQALFRHDVTPVSSCCIEGPEGSANVIDGSIKGADFGVNSVGPSEIADGSVTTYDIRDETIISNDIANNNVTSDDIQNRGVLLGDLHPAAVAAAGSISLGGSTVHSTPTTLDTIRVTAPRPGMMTIIVMGSAFLD
jgi:hypothetical protein